MSVRVCCELNVSLYGYVINVSFQLRGRAGRGHRLLKKSMAPADIRNIAPVTIWISDIVPT